MQVSMLYQLLCPRKYDIQQAASKYEWAGSEWETSANTPPSSLAIDKMTWCIAGPL